jgi:hypothetical protein
MAEIAFALPVRPGASHRVRELAEALKDHPDYATSQARHGMKAVRIFHQHHPNEMVIVYVESDDLDHSFLSHAESNHAFDDWFKRTVEEVTGHNLRHTTRSPSAQVLQWREGQAHPV